MLREDKHGKILQDKVEGERNWKLNGLSRGYSNNISVRARSSCYIGKSINLRSQDTWIALPALPTVSMYSWASNLKLCALCFSSTAWEGETWWSQSSLLTAYIVSLLKADMQYVINLNFIHSSPYVFQKNLGGYQICIWLCCVKINNMNGLTSHIKLGKRQIKNSEKSELCNAY